MKVFVLTIGDTVQGVYAQRKIAEHEAGHLRYEWEYDGSNPIAITEHEIQNVSPPAWENDDLNDPSLDEALAFAKSLDEAYASSAAYDEAQRLAWLERAPEDTLDSEDDEEEDSDRSRRERRI